MIFGRFMTEKKKLTRKEIKPILRGSNVRCLKPPKAVPDPKKSKNQKK